MEIRYFRLLAIIIVAFGLIGCVDITNQEKQEIVDKSLLNVKERGKLIVGADSHFPPFRSMDGSGNLVGYDVDISKRIASELGVELEIKTIPWTELFDQVKKGNVDLAISAITITEERTKEMLFSVPYFYDGQVILVKKENEDIKRPEDLKDKRIGVQKGTTFEKTALEYSNDDLVIKYEEYGQLINDLKEEKLDALVIDLAGGLKFVELNPELKKVGNVFTQEYYGIATKKGNNALVNEVNRVIRELKRTGKLKEMSDKWI